MANSAMWANFDALNASITRVVNAVDGQGSASLSVDTMATSVKEFAVGGKPSGQGADVFALQRVVAQLDQALNEHGRHTKQLALALQQHVDALRSAVTEMQETEHTHVVASDRLAAARVEEIFTPDEAGGTSGADANAGGYGDDDDDDDTVYV